MIRRDELMRIGKVTGLKPHQQEKHYVQTLVLRSLYSSFSPVFKGGTALMMFRGLNRFSEDLDFTTTEEFDTGALIETVVEDLEYIGIRTNRKLIADKRITFSFRIGAEGPLFTKELERCFVRVEISRREPVHLPAEALFTDTVYPDQLPFSVMVMDPMEVMAEKVRAVMTRNKARDIYDMAFLKGKGIGVDIPLVNKKLEYYDMEFERADFEKAMDGKKDIWRSELTSIIFGPIPEFDDIRRDILNLF